MGAADPGDVGRFGRQRSYIAAEDGTSSRAVRPVRFVRPGSFTSPSSYGRTRRMLSSMQTLKDVTNLRRWEAHEPAMYLRSR